MPIGDVRRRMDAVAALRASGGSPVNGQRYGDMVWDAGSRSFQDAGNVNDAGQQFNWAMAKGNENQGLAINRFKDLTNLNSGFNQGLFGMYMKMAKDSGPTTDTLFGVNKKLGGLSSGSSAAMATMQANAQGARAGEQAMGGFMKHMYQNEGVAQGYLGQGMDWDKAAGSLWNQKFTSDWQKDDAEGFDVGGILNQGLGLAGGILTGGLSTGVSAATNAVLGFSGMGHRIGQMSTPGSPDLARYYRGGPY